jgi:hypothetical protein
MDVYVFTNKEDFLKKFFSKNVRYKAAAQFPAQLPKDADFFYIDVTGITDTGLKKLFTQTKNISKNIPWGIIDPKGSINDTAALFFDGVSDYLGPKFFKASQKIDSKRIKIALQWRKDEIIKSKTTKENEHTENAFLKTGVKFPPANIFPGWKKMTAGKTIPFYLLYCSFRGKTQLETRFEEKALPQIHKRFTGLLDYYFKDSEGINWIDTGRDCLFLIPPKAKNIEQIIKDCLRMIICAPIITMETLAIKVPVNFVFVLHYGSISYKPPGKTGTVVSDAVNTIYHLGTKKALQGRLTVSTEVPDGTIPKLLEDCFVSAGDYKGLKIWHSKKITYEKPWD